MAGPSQRNDCLVGERAEDRCDTPEKFFTLQCNPRRHHRVVYVAVSFSLCTEVRDVGGNPVEQRLHVSELSRAVRSKCMIGVDAFATSIYYPRHQTSVPGTPGNCGDMRVYRHKWFSIRYIWFRLRIWCVENTDPQARAIRRATGRRLSDNRSEPTAGLYWPIPSRVLKSALSALSIVHQEYIFIDIGCGKGRALLVADEYPFKAIIGLEKRGDLIAIARQVIAQFGSNKTTINVIHTDACDFVLPGSNCVLFLFNPFETESFEKFFARTVDALQNRSIEIVIIYVSAPPKNVAAIRDSAHFRPVVIERVIPTWTDFRVEFFRSVSS